MCLVVCLTYTNHAGDHPSESAALPNCHQLSNTISVCVCVHDIVSATHTCVHASNTANETSMIWRPLYCSSGMRTRLAYTHCRILVGAAAYSVCDLDINILVQAHTCQWCRGINVFHTPLFQLLANSSRSNAHVNRFSIACIFANMETLHHVHVIFRSMRVLVCTCACAVLV